jgi:hypothetical protein
MERPEPKRVKRKHYVRRDSRKGVRFGRISIIVRTGSGFEFRLGFRLGLWPISPFRRQAARRPRRQAIGRPRRSRKVLPPQEGLQVLHRED